MATITAKDLRIGHILFINDRYWRISNLDHGKETDHWMDVRVKDITKDSKVKSAMLGIVLKKDEKVDILCKFGYLNCIFPFSSIQKMIKLENFEYDESKLTHVWPRIFQPGCDAIIIDVKDETKKKLSTSEDLQNSIENSITRNRFDDKTIVLENVTFLTCGNISLYSKERRTHGKNKLAIELGTKVRLRAGFPNTVSYGTIIGSKDNLFVLAQNTLIPKLLPLPTLDLDGVLIE